jgi:archaellum component FlaF (FlaF/FlaG flagellin family)
MESALVSLIIITVALFAALTLSSSYFSMQDAFMVARQEMEERSQERARTALTLVGAETQNGGAIIQITLKNDGATRLADFDQWDVVVQYYTAAGVYVTNWFPYVEAATPGDNQWTVAGIYTSVAEAIPEAYEPGILNPGEEIVIRIKVLPEIGPDTTNLATVAVSNGVSQSAIFVR